MNYDELTQKDLIKERRKDERTERLKDRATGREKYEKRWTRLRRHQEDLQRTTRIEKGVGGEGVQCHQDLFIYCWHQLVSLLSLVSLFYLFSLVLWLLWFLWCPWFPNIFPTQKKAFVRFDKSVKYSHIKKPIAIIPFVLEMCVNVQSPLWSGGSSRALSMQTVIKVMNSPQLPRKGRHYQDKKNILRHLSWFAPPPTPHFQN